MHSGSALASPTPKVRNLHTASAYCAAYVLLGLAFSAVGPCLNVLRGQTNSSTETIALLLTFTSLGYIGGSLLAGRLYDRIGGNRVLTITLLSLGLLLATVPWLQLLWLLIAVFTLAGLAWGVIDVGGNTLMAWLGCDDLPTYMNALHLSYGVGALVGPLITDRFAVATGNAVTVFWMFAALMIPLMIWLGQLPSPKRPGGAQNAVGRLSVFRRHERFIWLIALFFFLHVGASLTFSYWIFSYAEDVVCSETTARVINSAFWGGLVVGRLFAIPLTVRLSIRSVLQVCLLGGVASIVLIVALPNWSAALWIGTIGFGLSMGPLTPNGISFAGQRVPITGQISAVLLVGGSLGSMTLPWVVGQLIDSQGRMWMMYVTGASILAAVLLFALIRVCACPIHDGVRRVR
jgi:FHS family Na+ dependent glucose MFS transporter 1